MIKAGEVGSQAVYPRASKVFLIPPLGNEEAYLTAVNVVGTLSTDDPDITITTPTINFPDIPNGQMVTSTEFFEFDVSPDDLIEPIGSSRL